MKSVIPSKLSVISFSSDPFEAKPSYSNLERMPPPILFTTRRTRLGAILNDKQHMLCKERTSSDYSESEQLKSTRENLSLTTRRG
jgi:uncharacterized protein YegL